MRLEDLQYTFPEHLIATHPPEKRGMSRMMVFDRCRTTYEHLKFENIISYFDERDIIVFNNSKVIPARIAAKRKTGGQVEVFFLGLPKANSCSFLLKPAARIHLGEELCLPGNQVLKITHRDDRVFSGIMPDLIDGEQFLSTYGQMPLPPYIRRSIQERDKSDYQTTYATEAGSVAAPTAGLHFTPEIIDSLKARGTQVLNVTLHVGWGTFAPVLTRELKDHPMHREQFWIPEETAECLNKAKEQKRRITAVGTTTVRSLESAGRQGLMQSGSFDTNLLISPPHTFRFVDRLLTNFHQPGTTLLALVAAFVDPHPWRDLYEEGIKQEYRLFSYGDAMLIL